MIVSDKFKFIYLKGHKVAGSSVLLAAGKHCSQSDVVHRPAQGNPPQDIWSDLEWGEARNVQGLPREPLPSQIIAKIGRSKWEEYFKFSVVRNPWDLMISSYFWIVYVVTKQTEIQEINLNEFRSYILNPDKNVYKNSERYFDKEGNPILDFYIRYEQLNEDYKTVCEKVNMPVVELPRLKSNIRKSGQHYSQYYTDETREIVAHMFKREINYFNYSFEKNSN